MPQRLGSYLEQSMRLLVASQGETRDRAKAVLGVDLAYAIADRRSRSDV